MAHLDRIAFVITLSEPFSRLPEVSTEPDVISISQTDILRAGDNEGGFEVKQLEVTRIESVADASVRFHNSKKLRKVFNELQYEFGAVLDLFKGESHNPLLGRLRVPLGLAPKRRRGYFDAVEILWSRWCTVASAHHPSLSWKHLNQSTHKSSGDTDPVARIQIPSAIRLAHGPPRRPLEHLRLFLQQFRDNQA